MDPATQQFFAVVQNIQAQQNQPQPPPPPPAPRDKHKEFMSHHPPTYSHSTNPLDVDDWLKTVTKKLERAQCTDHEMVRYASGRLEGLASDWWDAYTATHPAPNTITWQQFRDAFRARHIPDGVLKLKQREFLALRQGNMSVNEYLDKFTQLSRYAPDEVNTDPKRQERFLDGLIGPLNYQLQSHTFPDFATLLNKAIGLENKRRELGEQKRKFQSQGQYSSILAHATAFHRTHSSALEDKVESILKTCSCSAHSSSPNASTHKLPALQTSSKTAQLILQVHQ
jgi:hypothetical protein